MTGDHSDHYDVVLILLRREHTCFQMHKQLVDLLAKSSSWLMSINLEILLVMGEPRAWLGRPARPKTFWLGSARSKLDVEARPGSSSPDEP